MDRREFVKTAFLMGIAALGLTGCLKQNIPVAPNIDKQASSTIPESPGKANEAPSAGPGLVVVQGSDPAELIEKGFKAMGGIDRFVKKGNLVVIKPNFSVPRAPEFAATTNIKLVSALVKNCLQNGAREVRVIDHPFTNGEICLEITGIRREVLAAGGKVYVINNLTDRFYSPVIPGGQILSSAQFSRDVLEADVFINFPILKHHNVTKLTMSLKNMMGLVWNRGVFHQTNLHRAIAELAAFKKPHLTIMDATRGITENGPMGPGTIREYNQVVFGTDGVAVDAYGADLFGLKPTDLEYLKIAAEMGLGEIKLDKLQITRV